MAKHRAEKEKKKLLKWQRQLRFRMRIQSIPQRIREIKKNLITDIKFTYNVTKIEILNFKNRKG
jgi:hypothetical protein